MQIHNPILTGSFTVNGVDVSSITGSSSSSASFASQIASLNATSASILAQTASLNAFSSSLLSYTSSNDAKVSSLNLFSSSILSYTSSTDAKITSIYTTTGSQNTRLGALEAATASLYTATSSFNAFSASILTYTSSINASVASLNSYTSSTDAKITSIYSTTSSLNTRVGTLEAYTSSLNNKTASFATTGSNTFVGTQTITGSVLQSGSFTSTGTLTAQTLVVQTITSSVVYSSGSNIFGNAIGNTQVFTGSVNITGSLSLNSITIPTSASLASTYLPLAGGTLTGALNGTSATFSSGITSVGGSNQEIAASATGDFFPRLKLIRTGGTTKTNRNYSFDLGSNGSLFLEDNTASATRLTIDTTGGNVGIGTTSPSEKLDVFGKIQARPLANGSSGNYWYMIGSITDVTNFGVANGIVVESPSLNSYAMTFGTQGSYITGITEKMRITSGGNVGIGTTSPDIFSRGDALNVGISATGSSDNMALSLNAGGSAGRGAQIYMGQGGTRHFTLSSNVTETTIGTITNTSFRLNSNDTTRIFISGSGNVGIGTTSPAYKLDVSGAGRLTSTLIIGAGSSATSQLDVTSNGSANGITLRNRDGDDYAFFNWRNNSGTELLAETYVQRTAADTAVMRYTIANGGSPATYLTIAASGAATFASGVAAINFYAPSSTGFWSDSYDVRRNGFVADGTNLIFRAGTSGTGEQTRMVIAQSTGNVGIGTTSPGTKLTIRASAANQSVVNITSTTNNNLFNFISNDTSGQAILDMGKNTESGTFAGGYIRLRTDGDSWIQGGNVGIGTTSPTHNLEIAYAGSAYLKLNADFGIGYFGMESADDSMRFVTAQATPIQFYTNNDLKMVILSGGSVGIGTTSPTTKLQVAGETTTSILTAANETNGQFQSRINGNSVNSQGACRWRTYARGIVATGTGTKLNIPFTSQGNLNIVTVARVLVCSADFNSSYGGSAQFMFSVGSLNALSNLQILSSGGNYSSATTSGMNVVVTLGGFAAAYIVIEYLTPEPSYSIDLGNITLTS